VPGETWCVLIGARCWVGRGRGLGAAAHRHHHTSHTPTPESYAQPINAPSTPSSAAAAKMARVAGAACQAFQDSDENLIRATSRCPKGLSCQLGGGSGSRYATKINTPRMFAQRLENCSTSSTIQFPKGTDRCSIYSSLGSPVPTHNNACTPRTCTNAGGCT
jgi:hypothetical protein